MSASVTPDTTPFASVAIVGVGLIGGSIAAALRRRAPATKVIGVGRSAGKLAPAIERGWLDATSENISAAARQADLVIFCTPVDRIVAGAHEAAAACKPGTLLTDAGSVKAAICHDLMTGLPDGVEFLGGHPLAGSEKTGFEFADAELYSNRVCVLTPHKHNSPSQVTRLQNFWETLGARVFRMDPEAHDKALAETSHMPHLVSSVVASVLSDENRPFTASGFRDTTRIAAGDPDLWTAILLQNAAGVLDRLKEFTGTLTAFRTAIEKRDAATLHRLLATAKQKRDALNGNMPPAASTRSSIQNPKSEI